LFDITTEKIGDRPDKRRRLREVLHRCLCLIKLILIQAAGNKLKRPLPLF
jgi:hypothetical protein